MLKTALCARYSSGLQRPMLVDDQLALCRDAAPRFNCEILPDHVHTDREISGSEEHREGYHRLLELRAIRLLGSLARERQIFLLTCRGVYDLQPDRLLILGDARTSATSTGHVS